MKFLRSDQTRKLRCYFLLLDLREGGGGEAEGERERERVFILTYASVFYFLSKSDTINHFFPFKPDYNPTVMIRFLS